METRKKILVVDDSSTSTFLMESFFEENGYIVSIAEDGNKAIEKVQKQIPDAIFLDLMMPKKSGFDVLTEIKQNDETKHVPVIIISAKTEQDDIQKAKALGAVEYLYKPIDIEYALNLLHKLEI
ncbi:response regulator [Salinivirga cyanobacteriivorans]|uniref:Stalked cell differentiation-controlling protein n=1 Tax=Salinivirga cyanobacteriivorans TaxID=1307839 RepID=A0A0S2I305_9BACT|nr:response regulator [Salinivirga cyanobacteriivorans]ALO16631.1 Stalked cell differentiation-controlling protein [Salinivirga cyanobacteriivorans]